MSPKRATLFTDGACRGNPGPGGWAALLYLDDDAWEMCGAERSTTNNRMELTAVIHGLREVPQGEAVEVYSDSKYVIDGITQWVSGWVRRNWRKADGKPVLNQELWQELLDVAEARDVTWQWVRGHAGHPENERVDALANEAIDAMERGETA